jgi:ligand-binding sensor domain-containing protein
MDPSNPHTLYLGSYRLYRTTDRADTWSVISDDLTKGTSFPYNSNIRFSAISAIAVAKNSPTTIYVGTSDGNLQVTTNGGRTFSNLNAGLPLRYISRIATDPANSQVAFVALSGFGSGHVFKTLTGGMNWSDISGNLPDIPVNALVLDTSSTPYKLYVGTDIGVFVADANGNIWTEVGGNTLPNSPVFDLEFNNNTKTLFAATFGRGAFKLTTERILPPRRPPIKRHMGDRRVETAPNNAKPH